MPTLGLRFHNVEKLINTKPSRISRRFTAAGLLNMYLECRSRYRYMGPGAGSVSELHRALSSLIWKLKIHMILGLGLRGQGLELV